MGHSEVKMERTEMRMIRWMCRVFPERKTVQHELRRQSRGKLRCDEKMQTEVAWTCRNKGRCRLYEGNVLGWWWKGRLLAVGQGRPGRKLCLLKVDIRYVYNQKKWMAIGWRKANPAASETWWRRRSGFCMWIFV